MNYKNTCYESRSNVASKRVYVNMMSEVFTVLGISHRMPLTFAPYHDVNSNSYDEIDNIFMFSNELFRNIFTVF